MSIKIGDYIFEGPYTNTDNIENKSGVYAILNNTKDKTYKVIDIGESKEVKDRLDSHDRKECWDKNCTPTIYYAVYYTENKQKKGRTEVEQELRGLYDLPCGER